MESGITPALFVFVALAGCNVPDFAPPAVNPDQNAGVNTSLGQGGCIKESDCRIYCNSNISECMEWCSENDHYLRRQLAEDYIR